MAGLVSEFFQNFKRHAEKKKKKKLFGIMCLSTLRYKRKQDKQRKDANEKFVHHKK